MKDQWHGGKGSTPRPVQDPKRFADEWDRIFSSKKDAERWNEIIESIDNNPKCTAEYALNYLRENIKEQK